MIVTGDGSEAFSAATTALDALDSYAFRVEINSVLNQQRDDHDQP